MKSDPTLLKWYRIINKRFFQGACPENVLIRWEDPNVEHHGKKWEDRYFGEANIAKDSYHDYQIVMSKTLNRSWITRMSTLIHEMIHLATHLRDDHGPAFEQWRQYIADKGIFKKHALRKGKTLF